jgi:hypothetical protein
LIIPHGRGSWILRTSRDKPPARSSVCKGINSFQSTVKAENKNEDALSWKPWREERTHFHKVEVHADIKYVRAIATVAAAGWDPAALRTEQLNDNDIGPLLVDAETEQRPEFIGIAVPCTEATGPSDNSTLWRTAY